MTDKNILINHFTKISTNKHNQNSLLLAGPVVPEPWDSLLDTESEEGSVVGGQAGGGTASEFSDRFSPRVLKTTVMSSWLRISCWEQTQDLTILYLGQFVIKHSP